MSKSNTFIYFVGTAGAGKSTLCGSFLEWCQQHGLDAVTVNLDPGVEQLPYQPDVDVRDWINLREIMQTEGLGPNGAQVAASDLLALQADKIKDAIDGFQTDLVLVDTPGQIELFVFRQSGKFLTDFLAPQQSMIAYLMDPLLAREASGYVSQMLLATSVQFRLGLPVAHVLSKADLLEEEDRDRILEWSATPDALHAALLDEQTSMYRELNVDLFRTMEAQPGFPMVFPVSSAQNMGQDDLYAAIQLNFSGGEDATADAIDSGDLMDP